MKRILLSILLLTASIVSIGAAQLTSSDPYWLGDNSSFGSTEGNDFWLTFMNNAMFDPSSPLNANITFELKIAISARQQTKVYIEAGATQIPVDVEPNTTKIVDVSDLYALIYLLNSEVSNQYKGVHVYTDEPDKNFSCFSYSRNGEAGESSRDATLIIPTKFMGKEYFVQTYYEDTYSSEFAIVATEPGTVVHIWPAYATSGGIPAGQEIIVPLEQGAAYLLASAPHQGNNIRVDLSGSKICSNKPIAVYNGNQQTSIPFDESYSKDYLSEQILPISQWGTDFYLAQLGNTNKNYFILTSAYDHDTIFMKSYSTTAADNYDDTIVMMAGETLDPEIYFLDGDFKETTIHCTKPTMCYVYTTSAALNSQCTGSGRTQVCYNYGDPANALMPSWAHRTTSMNFFTHELDPFSQDPNKVPPQKFYVYLVTKWDERNLITIDGQSHASDFHQFMGNSDMAYASVEINNGPNPEDRYHWVETTGDGFVGMVYAVTGAQGYLYTLGYTPDPFRDSLFVENPENIMVGGYDLPRIDQGWYQRQWDEWAKGHERLDTAQVCDSTVVKWMVQTPISKQTSPIEWRIYNVTNGAKPSDATLISGYPTQQTTPDETTSSDWIYRFEHQFILPDESDIPPEDRTPFMEYEIHAILNYPHLICNHLPNETDTLKTTVRVTRIYHDTIYQYICMGDSYQFFNDSFPNQGNLNQKGSTKSPTTFIADKTAGESSVDFQWKARLGENIYNREYQTIYGCDSTYTLYLFVCDTFRRVDTLHLCDNQSLTYEGKKFKGILAPDDDGTTVTKDTVAIIYDKTTYCPCKQNPKYPAFQGCDSIFELHLMMHKTYRDTLVDTMCYNSNPDSLYHWPIQYGARDSLIGKNHPNMVFNDELQAWIGYFSDTLQTLTCPECNNGNGCDSINILKLIIPKAYFFPEEYTECHWHYDYNTRQKVTNVYRWTHHRNGAAYVDLPDAGVYYDSCFTRYGCDSVYQLTLTYVEPYLKVDQHAMANNQTYTWHGVTYGPFTDPEFKNIEDTTLYFYDEAATVTKDGCDSIIRLDLTLMDTYLFKFNRTICDYDSVHWRDSIIVGSKWQGTDPFDIRLSEQKTLIFDSLKTVELPERDSVYQLTVTMWPSYEKYDTLYVCDNDSLQWEGQWYKGANGSLDDERHYDTKHHCDSAFYLHLLVKPSYHFPVEDSVVCQNDAFVWAQHTHIVIPTDQPGDFFYYDSCKTTTCPACEGGGCDSIYTLHLVVSPIHDIYDTLTICANDSAHWQGLLFTGDEFANYGGTYDPAAFRRVTENLHAGEHSDTAWYHTTYYGCDSIYHLTLYVHKVAHTDSLDSVCQGTPFFNPNWNWGQGRYMNTDHVGTFTSVDTIHSLVTGCDSIVTLTLRVDSVYDYTQSLGAYCQDTIDKFREWIDSEGISHGFVLDVSTTGLHTLGETHTTIHGCDSIYGVSWYVNPIYDFYETKELCENDTLEWEGMLFVGSQYAAYGKTYDPAAYDSVRGPLSHGVHHENVYRKTVAGCDSIYHLTLTIHEVAHTDSLDSVCQGTPFFNPNWNWGQGRYMNTERVGTYTSVDTIHSVVTGCDSIVTLTLRVDSVYDYTQNLGAYCQDTIDKFREWIDSEGISHGFVLDVSTVGLHTLGEEHHTIHGCDSIYGVSWYVNPIYDFYEEKDLCENDTLEWEGMLFAGSQYAAYGKTYDPAPYDSVRGPLSHGVHHENVYR
ncbi:MAG: IgGFc-binding protein, partial [Paludibacteraceae bacterium]|nr:IgGFc-binding protein [Paludibacteraceae bacterium]